MALRKSLEVLPMVDSTVNMTSRSLRSDAEDGRYRERDRRELCGVAQTTGAIANVIIESSAEWRILCLATMRPRPVHREVARAQDGRREQRALPSPPLVDSRLPGPRSRRLGALSCWALDLEFAEDEVAHKMHAHQCDLRRVANPSARDPFPPPCGH